MTADTATPPSPHAPLTSPPGEVVAITAPRTIAALLRWRAERTPFDLAMVWRAGGLERTSTWAVLWREVRSLATAWRARGLRSGMRIALVAPSGRAWDVAQLAASCLGAVVVGLDERMPPELIHRELLAARATAIVLSDAVALAALPSAVRDRLAFSTTLDAEIAAEPEELPEVPPDATATLITTSGTTGAPKRIAFTHAQLLVACDAVHAALGADLAGGATISWMPLGNLFQRMLNLLAIRAGATIHYLDDPRQLIAELPRIAPTFVAGVPRLFDKLALAVEARVTALPAWRRALAPWALRVGSANALADALVLRSLREIAGPRIRFLLTGSAATPRRVLDLFEAIGLPLLEAYGTSENTVPIALNTRAARRTGSVGRPLAPNLVTLAPDGEVLVRGPGLFHGYEDDDEGADCWAGDGSYCTGDLGRFDEDGFLVLTGRRREVIKTSTGRRVSPAQVETAVRELPGVEHAVVVGDGRTHLVGLLALEPSAPREALAAALTRVNAALPPHLRVHDWALLARPLSPAQGELTANGKLRRAAIAAAHAGTIAALYGERATDPSSPTVILRLDRGASP